jgi:phage FluMu gp28-like protein
MYYLGLDLGQKRDHSALVVVERIDERRVFQGTEFVRLDVRYVERMPLGTPYPKVVERVGAIVRQGDFALTVDPTGVGAPVVDMLRAARLGCDVMAVVITGGERTSGNGCVPKKDLMAGVQVLLENGQLKIGRLKEGARLMRELKDVRTSAGAAGRVRLGADGNREHDDLVIALALAC